MESGNCDMSQSRPVKIQRPSQYLRRFLTRWPIHYVTRFAPIYYLIIFDWPKEKGVSWKNKNIEQHKLYNPVIDLRRQARLAKFSVTTIVNFFLPFILIRTSSTQRRSHGLWLPFWHSGTVARCDADFHKHCYGYGSIPLQVLLSH